MFSSLLFCLASCYFYCCFLRFNYLRFFSLLFCSVSCCFYCCFFGFSYFTFSSLLFCSVCCSCCSFPGFVITGSLSFCLVLRFSMFVVFHFPVFILCFVYVSLFFPLDSWFQSFLCLCVLMIQFVLFFSLNCLFKPLNVSYFCSFFCYYIVI